MVSPPQTRPRPVLTSDGMPAASQWTLSTDAIHINHGSFGAVPVAAQARQRALRLQMEDNPTIWFQDQFVRIARARAEVADFLSTEESRTALVPNASAGVSTVYQNVPSARGMEIVTTNHAYGAVLEGARRLARRNDGHLRIVEIPLDADGNNVSTRIFAEVTSRTALIVLDQITSATARAFPIEKVAQRANELGIPLLVDGAHAAGILPNPVPDFSGFWVGNLHKFACAPRGTAALVALGPEQFPLYPLIDSWGYPHAFPDNFDHVGTQDTTGWMAARSAFDSIEECFGWDTFRTHARQLGDYAVDIITTALARETGESAVVDVGMPVDALRLIRLPGGLATDQDAAHALRRYLSRELKIETAITTFNGEGFLRLSIHLYNTAEDFEAVAERVVPELIRLSHSKRSL